MHASERERTGDEVDGEVDRHVLLLRLLHNLLHDLRARLVEQRLADLRTRQLTALYSYIFVLVIQVRREG